MDKWIIIGDAIVFIILIMAIIFSKRKKERKTFYFILTLIGISGLLRTHSLHWSLSIFLPILFTVLFYYLVEKRKK